MSTINEILFAISNSASTGDIRELDNIRMVVDDLLLDEETKEAICSMIELAELFVEGE